MKELLQANPAAHAISDLYVQGRRLLEALLLELRKLQAEAAPLHKVIRRYEKLQRATGGDADVDDEFLAPILQGPAEDAPQLLDQLGAMGLIVLQGRSNVDTAGSTVRLGADLDTEDLAAALEAVEEDEGIRALLRHSANVA